MDTVRPEGLPGLVAGLPLPPDPALDPFLDAAARCFVRYGVGRTSVQDVAKELGVNRTTVYRQVGTIDHQAMLLAARDAHRLVATLLARITVPFGPAQLADLVAIVVTEVRGHPVLSKMIADEPDMIGLMALSEIPQLIANARSALSPMLAAAMDAGWLARRDPEILADWLARIAGSLILAEPVGEVRSYLLEILGPALTP